MEGFEWDEDNRTKNWKKHRVSVKECEEVFFNTPLVFYKDISHSQAEDRYTALGVTNESRQLYITFIIRENNIRVISARDQNKKERSLYETEKTKEV